MLLVPVHLKRREGEGRGEGKKRGSTNVSHILTTGPCMQKKKEDPDLEMHASICRAPCIGGAYQEMVSGVPGPSLSTGTHTHTQQT